KGKVQFSWAQIRSWLKPAPSSPINIADDTPILLPLKIVAPAFVAATGAKKRKSGKESMNQELPDFFGPNAGGRPPAPAAPAAEDGHVVAQRLPAGLAADTFAAFMPQIFSRIDKYTGEMQLGETSEVSITTTGGPCRFIRNGKVFFATLGKVGESLPAGLKLV